MSIQTNGIKEHPIDVVITWVDGSDPSLVKKRLQYLTETNNYDNQGTHPTRFASTYEIKYCILSILKFASFVRNIYIVTDGQSPNIDNDVKELFPERLKSIIIVDHKEIFEGFEEFLPTFNSSAIETMIWRIKGLSENFVYFNDDFFLIREVKPHDWFINNRPVIRGKWLIAPYRKIISDSIKLLYNRHILKNKTYQPKQSFYLRQWNAAKLLGMKTRFFFHCHVPYTLRRSTLENFFSKNRPLLEKNLSYRFRHKDQYISISLANHLEIIEGNNQLVKLNLEYIDPFYHSSVHIVRKIKHYENDPKIKSICVQSLEMISKDTQVRIFDWMDKILGLKV